MPVLTLGAPNESGYVTASSFTNRIPTPAKDGMTGGIRWVSVAVPKDAIVNSATLSVTDIFLSSSLAVINHDNVPSLVNTGWKTMPGSSPQVVASTMDMTAAIQALVNRSGWVEGNALAMRMTAPSTSSPAEATITDLVIDWTPPWNAGPDQSVEPFSTVTLTGTPAGGTWTQVSGEPVSLGGSGETRTFTAPAKMTPHTLVFAYGTDEMTVIVDAAKHAIIGSGGVLIPTRMQVL